MLNIGGTPHGERGELFVHGAVGACGVTDVAMATLGTHGRPGVMAVALDLLAVVLGGAAHFGDLFLLDHHHLPLLVGGLLCLLQSLDLLLKHTHTPLLVGHVHTGRDHDWTCTDRRGS